MRLAFAIVLLALVAPRAHADDQPSAAPMKRAADAAAVCAALAEGLDPSLPCRSVGRAAMAGGAVAQLYKLDVQGGSRWMIAIDDHGTVATSPWFGFAPEDCAMQQCTNGQASPPKLRAILGGKAVVIELSASYTKTRTDPDTGKTSSSSWKSYDLVACGASSSGTRTCLERHLGDEGGRSCTGAIASDGTITATCKVVESLSLD